MLLRLFLPHRALVLLLSCGHLLASDQLTHDGRESSKDFSNEWVVFLEGGPDVAALVALKLGFVNNGEIDGFPDHYLLEKLDHPMENEFESDLHTLNLQNETRVLWAQQLFRKNRVKRGWIDDLKYVEEVNRRRKEEEEFRRNLRKVLTKEGERGISPQLLELWEEEKAFSDKKKGIFRPRTKSTIFNDLLWDHQWYMQDTRMRSDLPEITLNVLPVFEMGYTGKGVKIVVLDDGLEHKHSDLAANYNSRISYDYNDNDQDPSPRYPTTVDGVPNSHGTRCAGEIAMVANNKICGVGVAHNAQIGGIRMLDGKINDRIEGQSLQHAINEVDIFTASWGPTDDGKTVEAPGRLAQKAMLKGVKNGRDGKGIIYVWASGNGGMHKDNCNCDGYTSSIYTISIGSASEQGEFPWYGEQCSSTMASTYSSGAYSDQKIATTDTNDTCTVSHTGTSAAAPLAAGIIALALEANPSLSWRDVQHLVVRSSSFSTLRNNPGWKVNGAGFNFNSRFGFGILDAFNMVTNALKWKTVGKQLQAEVSPTKSDSRMLRSHEPVTAEFFVDGKTSAAGINHTEHVEVLVNIDYPKRGVLEVALVSPAGTVSQLLTLRPEDVSNAGFKQWKFMSVHFWGENPAGTWKLYVMDKTSEVNMEGRVGLLKLYLYGTKSLPQSEPMP